MARQGVNSNSMDASYNYLTLKVHKTILTPAVADFNCSSSMDDYVVEPYHL